MVSLVAWFHQNVQKSIDNMKQNAVWIPNIVCLAAVSELVQKQQYCQLNQGKAWQY